MLSIKLSIMIIILGIMLIMHSIMLIMYSRIISMLSIMLSIVLIMLSIMHSKKLKLVLHRVVELPLLLFVLQPLSRHVASPWGERSS